MDIRKTLTEHYTHGSLSEAILAAVPEVVPADRAVRAADLAPVDEFHIGGRVATERFMSQLDLLPEMRVLDVGAGLGGPARYMAESVGCHVTGIDLTPEYCEVGARLNELVGLAGAVELQVGDASAMAFADGAFDAAYTMHVAMNIPDKAALYAEVARVLKPGGVFGVYDIMAGSGAGELDFPVPWAGTPEISFLAAPEEMRALLTAAGFEITAEADRSAFAVEFFERLRRQAGGGPPPLGLHILMGDSFAPKVANMVANLANGRIAPWEMICRKR